MSTLAAIWDAYVKNMGKAVCSSSSGSLTQEVTSELVIVLRCVNVAIAFHSFDVGMYVCLCNNHIFFPHTSPWHSESIQS